MVGNKTQISASVDTDTVKHFAKVAEDNNRSFSQIVNLIMRAAKEAKFGQINGLTIETAEIRKNQL